MNVTTTYSIIILAALIHASFQLSVSTFTLMSGHHLGRAQSYRRLNRLIGGFLLGAITMTVLLLSSLSLLVLGLSKSLPALLMLAAACGLCFGVGTAVWLFYYPKGSKGTTLWIPRKSASYIAERCLATKNSGEAFGLGLASAFGELAFTVAPIVVAATVLITLSPVQQLIGVAVYAAVATSSLIIVAMLVGSGHKISRIQQWREKNKSFLQFAAGSALLILGIVIYVYHVYPYAIATGAPL